MQKFRKSTNLETIEIFTLLDTSWRRLIDILLDFILNYVEREF